MIKTLNIKKLREEKGMTQKDLVELTGLSQGTISSYEKGYKTIKRVIKTGNIARISKVLGISVEELLDEEKEEPENLEEKTCLNQACPLNENKKCKNDVVLNGKASCYGKDLIKDKLVYKSGWAGLAGRWEDYR